MAYKRGDVLLVPFPFTDLSTTKVRPAVVVSSSAYHRSELDLLLAAITSNVDAARGAFDYALRGWNTAGLKFPSAFKPVIFTLDPERVVHRIGALNRVDLAEVDKRLRLMLDLT
jgi:mRNA interferase MazF